MKKWATIPKIKIDFAYTSEELAAKEKTKNTHMQAINNRNLFYN